MNRLVVESLGKRYRIRGAAGPRDLWALKDVSFAAGAGEVLGVIGQNGAGKTTLLKVLSRVTLPTEGRVEGRGRVTSLLGLGVGMDPQLSGRENVFLEAAIYGMPHAEMRRRFDRIVEFAELAEFIDLPLRQYSSGMFMRLAFSIAINMDPDILLADEVLAVGDARFQERCLERVRQAGRAGTTVLFVSHDMAAIGRICQKALWLEGGRISAFGPADEVVARYETFSWSSTRPVAADTGEEGILAVRLVSPDGAAKGAVRLDEEFCVEIVFRVGRPEVKVRASIDLSSQAVHVLRSVQPEVATIPAPGTYAARVRIPKELLADAMYSVNAGVTVIDGAAERPLVAYNAVSFRAYEPGSAGPEAGQRTHRRHAGVVAPKLEWALGPGAPA